MKDNMDLEKIFNTSWWAKALIDRRAMDAAAHADGRGHQACDPHGCEPHYEDFELTQWEKDWIAERVRDVVLAKCTEGDKAVELLAEPEREHEARVCRAEAIDAFGADHETTIEHARARKAKEHDHRSPVAVQIDEHVHYVHRHRDTKRAEVKEARRLAAEHVKTAELVVSKQYEEHVEFFTAQVRDQIRALAPARPVPVVEAPPPVAEPSPAPEAVPEVEEEISPLLKRAALHRELLARAAASAAVLDAEVDGPDASEDE